MTNDPSLSGDSVNDTNLIVVGLGEVLFDCFPNTKVLGGAPVNVAVHANHLLSQSSGQGVVVSRVGNDGLGRELLDELGKRGVATDLMQVDASRPTGTVQVSVTDSGEPRYTIKENVAWDYLQFDEPLEQMARRCNAVCFGTLAQRREPSRSTIHRFLESACSAVRLFDVNLRQHYYSTEVLDASFRAASAVKLNLDELTEVGTRLASQLGSPSDIDAAVQNLQDAYEIDCVALTRGCQGTVLYQRSGRYELPPVSVERDPNADNVGAGDACSAGLVYGLLMDWAPEQTLRLANSMGAFVASKTGATPPLPAELLELARGNRPFS